VTALSAMALTGAFSSLLGGYLAERISERLLAVVSQALAALAVMLVLTIQTTAEAMVMDMVLGLLIRGEGSLTSIIVARYFGRFSYGRIGGVMAIFQLIALGLGPVTATLIFAYKPSYPLLYSGVASSYLVAATLFWAARAPKSARLQSITD